MTWVLIGAYVVCGLITGRVCATVADHNDQLDDEIQVAALAGAFLWPLAVVLGLGFGVVKLLTWKLPSERRENRSERLREQEKEAEKRMQEIRRMERELGIGDGS
jgi:uncharacterized protein HemX